MVPLCLLPECFRSSKEAVDSTNNVNLEAKVAYCPHGIPWKAVVQLTPAAVGGRGHAFSGRSIVSDESFASVEVVDNKLRYDGQKLRTESYELFGETVLHSFRRYAR